MDDNAAEYEYTFTMPDGEWFSIIVTKQHRMNWSVQTTDAKGNVIDESHDHFTKRGAAEYAVGLIIASEN